MVHFNRDLHTVIKKNIYNDKSYSEEHILLQEITVTCCKDFLLSQCSVLVFAESKGIRGMRAVVEPFADAKE